MLSSCLQCDQVVEIQALNEHLLSECEQSKPFRYTPPLGVQSDHRGCPMCGEMLPRNRKALRQHLMVECVANSRAPRAGA